jgi:hypothetical protein
MVGPLCVKVIASAKGAIDDLFVNIRIPGLLRMKHAELRPGNHFAVTEFRWLEVPLGSREGLERARRLQALVTNPLSALAHMN